MSKPLFADRWQDAVNVDELRKEIQSLYAALESLGVGNPPVDLPSVPVWDFGTFAAPTGPSVDFGSFLLPSGPHVNFGSF